MHDPSSRPSEFPRPFTDGEDGAPGSSAARGFVGFGSFRFRASDPFLLRDGDEIPLPPRAFEVLKLLLGRPGQVVSKRELLERAWSDAVVGDNALTQTISQLREILGDDAEDPRFIQTVPRQGYRFIAEVERLEGSDGAPLRGSPRSNERGGGISPGRLAAASFLAVGGFVLGVIVAIVLGLGAARGPEQVAPKRFVIELPEGAPLLLSAPAPLDISADGNRIVYTGGSRERWNLYTKRLDETAWHTLGGTEGARYPVFSPDGRWIAYVAETRRDGSVAGEVRKVPSDGGPPVVVGAHSYDDLPDYSRKSRWQRHLTWEPDGWIYFDDGHSIWRIRPSGGEAVLVARPPLLRLQYRWAQLLPGRERILFQAKHFGPGGALEDRDVRVQRITPGEGGADGGAEILIRGMYFFRWVPSGHLLTYDIKGHGDAMYGVMYAQRFDPGTLALGERRVPVLEIWNDFALSASGTLAYFSLDAQPKQSGRFQWFDREGTVADTWHPEGGVACWPPHSELSPDGSRLVTNCHEWGDGSTLDLWIVDLGSGLRTRVTQPGRDFSPIWSPSGDRIAYSSERDGRWRLVSVDVDRLGEPTVLLGSEEPLFPQAWSDDGGSLVYVRVEEGEDLGGCFTCSGDADIWTLPLDRPGQAAPIVSTDSFESRASLSPDGRWLAYHAEALDDWHVFVVPFPEGGRATRVSSLPAGWPAWSPDGSRLYYLTHEGREMMEVAIAGQRPLRHGEPVVLFRRERGIYQENVTQAFDVAPDGRFIFWNGTSPGARTASRLEVVRDWVEELERLLPTG